MRYSDIIDTPRPKSKYRKMSLHDRAAQFSPFAALTGFDEEIKETSRFTQEQIELLNEDKLAIGEKIRYVLDHKDQDLLIYLVYFEKDPYKKGGKYRDIYTRIKKYNELEHYLLDEQKEKLYIDNIMEFHILEKENLEAL